MNKQAQLLNEKYEALLFARTPQTGRVAAREFVRTILGDEGLRLSLEEGLRRACRIFRPSSDPREQVRFEAELIELAVAPNGPNNAQTIAA